MGDAQALDVANWQGNIRGGEISADGVQLVIVKVSEGTWSANAFARQQVAETIAAGMRVGAYHFPRPDRGWNPVAEAEAFVVAAGAAGALVPGTILALDMEGYPGIPWPLDAAGTVEFMGQWRDTVQAHVPDSVRWWYSYPSFIATLIPVDARIDAGDFGLWIADPSNLQAGIAPRTGGRNWFLGQYGVGEVPGVDVGVDVNLLGPAYSGGAAPAPGPGGRPTLRSGSTGDAVIELQQKLTVLNYGPGPVDGAFGGMTHDAVLRFQADALIEVDGVVGPQTWDALDRALAPPDVPPVTPPEPEPPVPEPEPEPPVDPPVPDPPLPPVVTEVDRAVEVARVLHDKAMARSTWAATRRAIAKLPRP